MIHLFNLLRSSYLIGLLVGLIAVQSVAAEGKPVNIQIAELEQKLEKLSAKPGTKAYGQALFDLGKLYFYEEKYDLANPCFLELDAMTTSQIGAELAIKNRIKIGDAYFWQSKYDSAAVYLNTTLAEYAADLTTKDSTRILQRLGDTYSYMGDFQQAHNFKFIGIETLLRQGGEPEKADAFYSLGEIYYEQGHYSKAIEKLEASAKLYEQLGQISDISYCEDLLGNVYFEMEDYQKALEYKVKSSNENYGLNSAYIRAYSKHTIAETYVKLNQFQKAFPLLMEALEIREETGQLEESIQTGLALANWYVLQGNCQKGKIIFQEYQQKAERLGVLPVLEKTYETLAEANYTCGNYKEAFDYKSKFIAIRDSVYQEATKIQVANLGAIYELKERNQQVAVLQKENEVNNLYIILGLCLGGLLFLSCLAIYWMFSKESRYNGILKEKNKKIEDQVTTISKANEQLQNVNQDLEQFAYIVSHDLKAPLRTIGSYTSLLNRRYAKNMDETGHEFLGFVLNGVSHMKQLLDDVLVYSKLKTEEIELNPIDLKELIGNILQNLDSSIQENNAVIVKEYSGTVLGNSTQLFQLIQNLIDNALKFIPENRQPILQIKTKKFGDKIQIGIKDNGIGIQPEYHEQIFTPFKRLHNTTEFKGTGVGLAICKRIVEKHQGEIWLESDGQSGTTFYFTLLAQASKTSDSANPEADTAMENLVFFE